MVISAECNFEEAAREGAAIQVESFDESSWAAAIDSVCLNQDVRSRMSGAASRLAPAFSWDSVVEKWLEVYASLALPPKEGRI
jgi:glycosyltransferase involved in cell wall biosynthesis